MIDINTWYSDVLHVVLGTEVRGVGVTIRAGHEGRVLLENFVPIDVPRQGHSRLDSLIISSGKYQNVNEKKIQFQVTL